MSTTIKLYANRGAKIDSDFPNTHYALPSIVPSRVQVVQGFESVPQAYLYKKVESARIYIKSKVAAQYSPISHMYIVSDIWDESSATYATISTILKDNVSELSEPQEEQWMNVDVFPSYHLECLKYGFSYIIFSEESTYSCSSSYKPYLSVTFSDEEVSGSVFGAPSSGYVNDSASKTFSWQFSVDTSQTIGAVTAAKNVFRWRISEDSNITEIETANGGTASYYTVPANTFPSTGTFQWQAAVTDTRGVTTYSPWYTINTTEATATATALSPNNEVIDGSSPIKFIWRHKISTGTAQTKAEFQWGPSGGHYQSSVVINGNTQSYTAPANTFPAGTIYWRVKTYNSDGIASEWSDALSFICVAPGPAPNVSAEPVPLAEISWQAQTQQAYRIVGEGLEKTFFGDSKVYKFKTPLSDGPQTVSVSVQNEFGLWSPAGVADFTVQNIPGEPIELSAKVSHVAELRWNSHQTYNSYLVYRENKLIAETQELSFTDIYSTGLCSYRVIGLSSNGNYTASNTVSVRICVEHSIICNVESKQWLSMKLSNDSSSEQTYTLSRAGTVRHYLGSKFPTVELSEFESKTSNYTVAFKTSAEAAAFEALKGKTVCIKSRRDEITVGVLLNMSKIVGDFFTVFEFSLQRIHWEGLD